MITRTGILFCALITVLLIIAPPAEAQQPKRVPRIGVVSADGDRSTPGPQVEAFRQGLRGLGYVEGKNILVEYRYVEGKSDRIIPGLVAELVQLKVDALVMRPRPAIRAAKQATKTIPIVMVTTQDPVAAGFIYSLARPGGNITGITTLQRELSGKRLELLKDVLPGLARVAVLMRAEQGTYDYEWYEAPARALKIQVQLVRVRDESDFNAAFESMPKARTGGFIAVSGSLFNRQANRIADLAIKNRLPSIYERPDYVQAGGLMSYSANDTDSFKRAAIYVDKILKGAKPADLPVEQPTEFELAVNLRTAKQIGLTIPPNVLARADKVIK
ncbi:MAG: ABC transporter substrate-binding protein [Deltaproteobacteria bacterium]|nr:ABC transporter substrate-binding protein [Deltaproteobacteria bacterium]